MVMRLLATVALVAAAVLATSLRGLELLAKVTMVAQAGRATLAVAAAALDQLAGLALSLLQVTAAPPHPCRSTTSPSHLLVAVAVAEERWVLLVAAALAAALGRLRSLGQMALVVAPVVYRGQARHSKLARAVMASSSSATPPSPV